MEIHPKSIQIHPNPWKSIQNPPKPEKDETESGDYFWFDMAAVADLVAVAAVAAVVAAVLRTVAKSS